MKESRADFWDIALKKLSSRLSLDVYQNIIEHAKLLKVESSRVVLTLPYAFMARRISPSERLIIESILSDVVGKSISVDFLILNEKESVKSTKIALEAQGVINKRKKLLNPETNDKDDSAEISESKGPRNSRNPRYLNGSYTFDNFIVGNSNLMAHAASLAVAQRPGEIYNPLFIYGGVGLGKTHLLHAIGHQIKSDFPEKVIRICPAEVYTNQLIDAIGDKEKLRQFRSRYRHCDLLLIDDIHFLIDKEATQEAFFHTFNFLYELDKQIVITSDRHPRELRTLKERLINRFQLGLIVDIQKPQYETRLAILKRKANLMRIQLEEDIMEFFANRVQGSIRSLEGCLKAAINIELSLGRRINLDEAQSIADSYSHDRDPDSNPVTLKTIMNLICHHYRVPYEGLIGPSRESHLTHPRHIAMYLARKHTSHSLKEIARAFQKKDHATVYHGVKKIEDNINVDAVLAREVKYIEDLLVGNAPIK